MKNLMLYIVDDERIPSKDAPVRRMLDLQVANSLALGWSRDDILLYTNFPYRHDDVDAIEVAPPPRPRTARATSFYKTFCILHALERMPHDELIWYHDTDAFQLIPFEAPTDSRVLGFCLYSTRQRLLVQGGSMFFSRAVRPIFEQVWNRLVHDACRKDEFALTDAAGDPELMDRFRVIDYSYNLGTTDFALRYQLAEKPIKVVHFHPERAEHRAVFVDGANSLDLHPLDERFLSLLIEHGFTEAREEKRGWLPRVFGGGAAKAASGS
ncbi:MAG: hypothetical protein AAGD38_13445 [Acidobacteriota bacterium]